MSVCMYIYCSDKQTAINAVAQKISFCNNKSNFFSNYDMNSSVCSYTSILWLAPISHVSKVFK